MGLTEAKIEAAMMESGGYVTSAAEALGCTRQTIYNWFEKCPELNKTRRFAQRDLLDLAKKTARQALRDGDKIMAIYILKSLGKNEGFAERREHTGKDGKDLNHTWEFITPESSEVEVERSVSKRTNGHK